MEIDAINGVNEPRSRACIAQYAALLAFVEKNMELVIFEPGPHARLRADALWHKVTDNLNSIRGGVRKTTDKWKKVWSDWKSKTKKKALNMRRVGGFYDGPRLNVLEKRIVNILETVDERRRVTCVPALEATPHDSQDIDDDDPLSEAVDDATETKPEVLPEMVVCGTSSQPETSSANEEYAVESPSSPAEQCPSPVPSEPTFPEPTSRPSAKSPSLAPKTNSDEQKPSASNQNRPPNRKRQRISYIATKSESLALEKRRLIIDEMRENNETKRIEVEMMRERNETKRIENATIQQKNEKRKLEIEELREKNEERKIEVEALREKNEAKRIEVDALRVDSYQNRTDVIDRFATIAETFLRHYIIQRENAAD